MKTQPARSHPGTGVSRPAPRTAARASGQSFAARATKLCTLATACLAVAGKGQMAHAASQPVVVKGENVNVRSRPSLAGEVLGQVNSGTVLGLLDQVSNANPGEPARWARVQLPATVPVWVHSDYIQAETVQASRLNLRSGPGEDSIVLGQLQRGDKVKVMTRKGNWLRIEVPARAQAFIAADYLIPPSAPSFAAAPPVPVPPAPASDHPIASVATLVQPVLAPVTPPAALASPSTPPEPPPSNPQGVIAIAAPAVETNLQTSPILAPLPPVAASNRPTTSPTTVVPPVPPAFTPPPALASPSVPPKLPPSNPQGVIAIAAPAVENRPQASPILAPPSPSSLGGPLTLAAGPSPDVKAPISTVSGRLASAAAPRTDPPEKPVERTFDLEKATREPKNEFSLGYFMEWNVSAKFQNTGRALFPPPAPGRYDDGFVLPSSRGNIDGYTWNWGYQHASQYDAANGLIMSRSSLPGGTVAATQETQGSDLFHGMEAAYHRVLWEQRDRPVRLGIEAAFTYAPMNFGRQSQLTTDSRLDRFTYPLQGVHPPIAPYQGTFDGPGAMILDNPTVSSENIVNGVVLSSARRLDLDMYGFRVGSRLSGELMPRLVGMVDAGVAVVVVDGQFAYQDTLQAGPLTVARASGRSGHQGVLPGGYVGFGLQYLLGHHWGLQYQVKFQYNGEYNQNADGRSVGVSLNPGILQMFGLSYSF